MKNLLPILALLLLVGCTSEPTPPTELERCIEANYAELKINYYEKWHNHLVKSDEDYGQNEWWLSLEKTLNRVEKILIRCVKTDLNVLERTFPGHRDWSGEERLANQTYQSWWDEHTQTCKAKEVEKVTKICNAQGIY